MAAPQRDPVPEPSRVVPADGETVTADVVVVGSSSGGVASAIAAAREGADVLLVSEVDRVGGMVTNGVTTDLLDPTLSSGLLEEWRREVAEVYRWSGVDPSGYQRGLFAPPAAALEAMERLLYTEPVRIMSGWWVNHTDEAAAELDGERVRSVTVTDGRREVRVDGEVFIDATVEGDLLAVAGKEGELWTFGREGRDAFGETLAPPQADRLVQANTYRVTVRVGDEPPEKPDRYEEWAPLYDQVSMDRTAWRCVERIRFRRQVFTGGRVQRCLPDGMMDINIDLVGIDRGYIDGSRTDRAEIATTHREFVTGWIWHLANVHGWPIGIAEDQYADGWPEVLYVREGRRLLGQQVFTQQDATSGARFADSVAVGFYGLDSHCIVGSVSGADDCVGGWWAWADPYEVPYGIIVPRTLANVLAPVPVSASRVGYQTLRMEPVRMALGTAAGVAAAAAPGGDVTEVDVTELRRQLVEGHDQLVDLPAG